VLEFNKTGLVYVDPPYAGGTKHTIDFDHNKFWRWVLERRDTGCTVIVSEATCPIMKEADLIVDFGTSIRTGIHTNKDNKTEKLFFFS
jgi:excinuclease UvrABC ATPase subunit